MWPLPLVHTPPRTGVDSIKKIDISYITEKRKDSSQKKKKIPETHHSCVIEDPHSLKGRLPGRTASRSGIWNNGCLNGVHYMKAIQELYHMNEAVHRLGTD